MRISSKTVAIRYVAEEDAEFITRLRTDEKYNKYLSAVSGDVESQRAWIRNYKDDEARGLQYYFIVERLDGTRCGTVRIYDMKPESFCWGSWILNEEKTPYAALESAFLVYEFGFGYLGFNKSHFEVRKGNEKVVSFHQKMGAVKVGENELYDFFEIDKEAVALTRVKLSSKLA